MEDVALFDVDASGVIMLIGYDPGFWILGSVGMKTADDDRVQGE